MEGNVGVPAENDAVEPANEPGVAMAAGVAPPQRRHQYSLLDKKAIVDFMNANETVPKVDIARNYLCRSRKPSELERRCNTSPTSEPCASFKARKENNFKGPETQASRYGALDDRGCETIA